MRHYLTAGFCAAASLASTAKAAAQDAKDSRPARPNIILIYIDDMGYGDPACYGGKFTPTPNIDRIGQEGVRLNQFYVASPISSASRVGVTTGMYPTRWAISTFLNNRKFNARNEQNDFLSVSAPSLARTLQQGGYATGHFGKWHMGGGRDVDNAPSIKKYGFDEYVSTWESPDPDPLLTATDWIWSNQDSVKRWDRTAYFVDKALDFLRRHKDTPCYINLWPDDMHAPWVPDSKVADAEKPVWVKQSSFTPVLARLDVQIGRLMRELRKMGLDENTIVIFSSDNGPEPSFQNKRTAGMRGQKGSLYEGGIRVPFMLRWKGVVEAGRVNESTVMSTVDLFPTLCAMAGVPAPADYRLDGMDCSAALTGREDKVRSEPLFWEYGKNFTVPDPAPFGNVYSPHLAVRLGKWKLLTNGDGKATELYDLAADPLETTNVAADNPQVAATLKKELLAWYRKAFRQYADK